MLEPKRILLKDIAIKIGIHVSTVSLALREDKRIAPATRARVQKIARELGYTPDPILTSLANYRRAKRTVSNISNVLAYLTDAAPQTPLKKIMLAAATQRAEKLGYRLEVFRWEKSRISLRRTLGIIRARGIRGILLDPKLEKTEFAFQAGDGPVVALSHRVLNPDFHRVTYNQFGNLTRHLEALRALGYRRLGLMLKDETDTLSGGNIRAAFMLWNYHHPADAIPEIVSGDAPAREVRAWIARHRVEAIVGGEGSWCRLTREEGMRFPEEAAFSALSHGAMFWETRHEFAGLCEQPDVLGCIALNHLVSLIDHRYQGLMDPPVAIQVNGVFNPGPTAPGLPAAK